MGILLLIYAQINDHIIDKKDSFTVNDINKIYTNDCKQEIFVFFNVCYVKNLNRPFLKNHFLGKYVLLLSEMDFTRIWTGENGTDKFHASEDASQKLVKVGTLYYLY